MKSVLIVEDQEEIRELIRVTLEFEDFAIDEACNGEEGLRKAQGNKPNLVLMDVMMPGAIDGLTACSRIRSDPNLANTKVVMLTSRSDPSDRAEGLRKGASAYLLKPFSPLELITVCQKVLR